jgi:hypothetical protein
LSSFEKSSSRTYPEGSKFTSVEVEVRKLENFFFQSLLV